MQKMSNRALELWKENLPLQNIRMMMRLEGYSFDEIDIVERWLKERFGKHRNQDKDTNTIN